MAHPDSYKMSAILKVVLFHMYIHVLLKNVYTTATYGSTYKDCLFAILVRDSFQSNQVES